MTFLGLEQPVKYGRELVFDPTTALMVLNANRDYVNAVYNDYVRGLEEMKDFNKEYGDFLSPIQKDMEWYDLNVTGKVRNFINDLYSRGVDPLRSAEGRAAVSKLIYTMPTGKIAQLRLSAEAAKEYLKNKATLLSKGLWNSDFERMILDGKSLEDWDTIGGRLVWTRTSPAEYQDLNLYTSHIFDNIKDSYIGTDKQHYDWYGVTENDLYKSLTPDKLGGILNTDLGRFHYLNAIADLAAKGIVNPTDNLKLEQFRKNIVAANHERVHQDRKLNDLWKMQQENAARRDSSRNPQLLTPQWSFMEALRRATAANAAGMSVLDWGKDGKSILSTLRDAQIDFGKRVSKNTNGHSATSQGIQQFVDLYEQTTYDPSALITFLIGSNYKYVDGKPVPRWNMVDNNTIRIYSSDANRIFSKRDVVSNTTGFRGKRVKTNRDSFNNADYIDVTLSGGVYGAYTKDARNENHFRISKLSLGKQIGTVDLTQEDGTIKKIPKYKTTVVKNAGDFYFDSHITSIQDDRRAGALGTTNNSGKIKETPGITVTNTQDLRYMDAVQGDMFMSEINTNNTGYDFSATLPELLGFGL